MNFGDLRKEMLKVRDEHGVLTPEAVVATATPRNHPLHSRFEWDNRVAGHKYRVWQAHQLIRVARIRFPSIDPSDKRTVRAFQAVRSEGEKSYVYEPSEEIALDPFKRTLILREMEREWRQLLQRYERFSEFLELVRGDIEDVA